MKNLKKIEKSQNLNEQIAQIVDGLTYLSEIDAEITPFYGEQAELTDIGTFLRKAGLTDVNIEERSFEEFFEPLIKKQKWFGKDERKMTEKFIQLKELLQRNLTDKKVFRIGKKNIQILVVGVDANNFLCGIQTSAVET